MKTICPQAFRPATDAPVMQGHGQSRRQNRPDDSARTNVSATSVHDGHGNGRHAAVPHDGKNREHMHDMRDGAVQNFDVSLNAGMAPETGATWSAGPDVALPFRQARTDGLALSAIGLGCMGLSEFYPPREEARARDLMLHAIERGERFFDTTNVYGFGQNEQLVGDVLRDHPLRSQIVLATQGCICTSRCPGSVSPESTGPELVRLAIARSQDRLQTDIDLYCLRWPADDDLSVEEVMSALADELTAGNIGAVGLGDMSPSIIRRADAALRRFSPDGQGLAAMQTEYPLRRSLARTRDIRATCVELGMLMLVYSPLCHGLQGASTGTPGQQPAEEEIIRRLLQHWGEQSEHNQQLVQVLCDVAREESLSPAQVLQAWTLTVASNVVLVSGARHRALLDETLDVARIVLSDEARKRVTEAFVSLPQLAENPPHPALAAHPAPMTPPPGRPIFQPMPVWG